MTERTIWYELGLPCEFCTDLATAWWRKLQEMKVFAFAKVDTSKIEVNMHKTFGLKFHASKTATH